MVSLNLAHPVYMMCHKPEAIIGIVSSFMNIIFTFIFFFVWFWKHLQQKNLSNEYFAPSFASLFIAKLTRTICWFHSIFSKRTPKLLQRILQKLSNLAHIYSHICEKSVFLVRYFLLLHPVTTQRGNFFQAEKKCLLPSYCVKCWGNLAYDLHAC